jgi:lysophospholipid acyltransferase (LPLAT)-like uncharacterized protein
MRPALFGLLLGLLARLWVVTLRVRFVLAPAARSGGSPATAPRPPWAFALWHGHILPLLAFRFPRPTVALVSLSRDGALLARALGVFGLDVERGSASRGGRGGLRRVVERMQLGSDALFALDGPRGPRRLPRPGVIAAAERAEGLVVPLVAACDRCWIVPGSWDRFELPVPFSRVAIAVGEPLAPGLLAGAPGLARLRSALDEAADRARALLAADRVPAALPRSVREPG